MRRYQDAHDPMNARLPAIGLTRPGCVARQERLRQQLSTLGLDAALLTAPEHVMYFTNHWARAVYAGAVLLPRRGPVVLAAPPGDRGHVVADEVLDYRADRLATLVDDQPSAALEPLVPLLKDHARLGCDDPRRPWRLESNTLDDLNETLSTLRRRKDPDEVDMIRHAISGCDAAYAAARELLEPGVSEVRVYAAMQAAAVEAVGEPIGEFGNDFQAGTPGGPPRPRGVEAGELMPLDIGVVVRGYHCDLCRTFSVDRNPTPEQKEARRLLMNALEHVEKTAVAGTSCRRLYEEAFTALDGRHGWKFSHHLGHGIGLGAHEAPRLNPNWDDTLEVRDVFTVEPGLYGRDLRGGIRIEQNYLVAESGLERLSHFPTDL